jgi:hypothetical protein
MPLDSLQKRIIRTALALPQARTLALAGGCAVIVHGLVDHSTCDVDLFTERDADEALELRAALRAVLAEAADKMLALWGRAEPRDFLDVVMLRGRYDGARLLELAAEKDRGFTLATFRESLGPISRISPQRWAAAGIDKHRAPSSTPLSKNGASNWRVEQVRIRSGHLVCPTAALHTTTLIVESEVWPYRSTRLRLSFGDH